MAKWYAWFSFEREAKWLTVMYVMIPLLAITLAMLAPRIISWWIR